jgi:hypothetical protein
MSKSTNFNEAQVRYCTETGEFVVTPAEVSITAMIGRNNLGEEWKLFATSGSPDRPITNPVQFLWILC